MSKYFKIAFTSFISAGLGTWFTFEILLYPNTSPPPRVFSQEQSPKTGREWVNDTGSFSSVLPENNFVDAATVSTPSVVFIKNLSMIKYRTGHWMDWFFEPRTSQRVSTGSGVIVSKDGYIVTNNHVIDEADEIEVVHEKRNYKATVIGTDPSTDLAVIKIETGDLPAITLGTSSNLRVGQWVLAVGNPFNLTSTVTAGIVSAKGRNINILQDKFPIESFIQTDAAINPGNSGGALVNKAGDLVGINTAILSRTGSYAGYGFAIPVDIVKKVFQDLVKYGQVQKVFLGAEFSNIDHEMAKELKLANLNGVIITHVQKGWAADQAGLKKGDIIVGINGSPMLNKAQIEEWLAYKYPGDLIQLSLHRENKNLSKSLRLTNSEGDYEVTQKRVYTSKSLQAAFEKVPKVEAELFDIPSGIRVVDTGNGFFRKLNIPTGFIITAINHTPIKSSRELERLLEKIQGKVIISGITESGRKVYYPFLF